MDMKTSTTTARARAIVATLVLGIAGTASTHAQTIEQGLLQHSAALARDLKRFDEIDRVSRLTLDGVRNLLDAQLNGDNKAGMEKSKADIDKYLLEGVTTWKQ